MRRPSITLAAAAVAVAVAAGPAAAVPIPIGNSTNTNSYESGLGKFSGSIDVQFVSANEAKLTLVLKNEQSTSAGGSLIAFAFNNPDTAKYTLSLTSSGFASPTSFFGSNNVKGGSYGDFDAGVSGAPNANANNIFTGGGSAAGGLAIGSTGTFTFKISGTGAGSLTANTFVNTPSSGPSGGKAAQFLLVRFRGFDNGGSDMVGAVVTPEPASLTLAGLPAAGVGVAGLRRRAARRRELANG